MQRLIATVLLCLCATLVGACSGGEDPGHVMGNMDANDMDTKADAPMDGMTTDGGADAAMDGPMDTMMDSSMMDTAMMD